ncbi:MAG TPA: hypothetical protein VFR18_16975 [Terriglobia bacterium]|nr:hypothetical protein [Terriglobia bacterium]
MTRIDEIASNIFRWHARARVRSSNGEQVLLDMAAVVKELFG